MKKLSNVAFKQQLTQLVSSLKEGDTISFNAIEPYTDEVPGTKGYSFELMFLKKFIEDNTNMTCKIEGDSIHILTPVNASEYNSNGVVRHLAGAKFRHTKNLQVNTEEMDDHNKKAHEHITEVQGKVLQAADAEAKKYRTIKLDTYKNSLPSVFPKTEE